MAEALRAGAAAAAPSRVVWLLAVAFTALNLRPFLTAIGPLSGPIQADTGLGLDAMAWLTLLPMGLMGVGAWCAPAVLRWRGARATVAGALAVLALGCLLRWAGADGGVLIASAAVCGAGVALVQGALPGIVKRELPGQVAPVMGLYSAALMGGGALGAQLSPWAVQQGARWTAVLAAWALPAALAAAGMARMLPRSRPAPAAAAASAGSAWLLRRPRTWWLMACFGLVNGGYASAVAWLAPYYQAQGWGAAASGGLVALMAVSQAVAALLLPWLAAKRADRRPWIWLTLAAQAAGFAALALAPGAAPTLWAVVLGAGLGGCFALVMVLALDHLPDPVQAGALSALMQGGGFVLAGLAPWVVARLHGLTGGFAAGWWAHLACVALVTLVVAQFAPQRYAQAMRG
jgi:CP family cyanate transporter-like MFS transporter